jgi:acetyl-CoA C-acetyltransferase
MAAAASAVVVIVPAIALAQAPAAAKPSETRQVPAETTAAARKNKNWAPPKTAWGHPDLQGIWTSDDMRSVPTSRPGAMAGRTTVTPEEFTRRASGDDASRDRAVNKETVLRNEFGVRTFGYTSLVTDPADGRIPPMTPEAMSHAPLLYGPAMVNWLAAWYAAKNMGQKAALATRFRLSYLAPVIAILRGLTDPIVKISMGSTAEIVVKRFGITRGMMDEFAVESHRRTAFAQDNGHLTEVEAMYGPDGTVYSQDDGVRRDSSVEKLAKLKPVFDRTYGNVTAGNSSQVTDGAAMLILASEDVVNEYALKPLGRVVDTNWGALDPSEMGLGPVHAITPLLMRNGLTLADMDAIEVNEAFAAQVLGCLAAWESDAYCKEHFGLDRAFGKVDRAKLNVDGGAIAIGHPIGASGARVVLHALKVLQRTGGRRAVASLCIGGGQGGAMLLERV